MSDASNQNVNPKDSAQKDGDDETAGRDAAELQQSIASQGPDSEGRDAMPAANQAKTEPTPTTSHESSPSSGTVGSDDPQAQ